MEIVVASGKGGTGKTFIASNLLYYLTSIRSRRCVGLDADVEAPDLAIALGGYREVEHEIESRAGRRPYIDYSICIRCGRCVSVCRFGALSLRNGVPIVDIDECEGCGVCAAVCPVHAIRMVEHRIGKIVVGITKYGVRVVSGDLDPGGSNSGKLVYELKAVVRELYHNKAEIFVVDAAAGIGCPVISSIAGANLVIIVVEPTPQSIQGAERLKHIAETLHIKHIAIVNKWDLNPDAVKDIEKEFDVIGRVPFDRAVFESYTNMTPSMLYDPESRASKILLEIFDSIYSEFLG